MQGMYTNSNEDMIFKLIVSLEQGVKSKTLESPPRQQG